MLRRSPSRRKTPLQRTGWIRRTAAKIRRRRDTGPDKPTRIRLVLRSGGICERYGINDAVQCHHRRPRRLGGSKAPDTNMLSNLGYLCLACHMWVEGNRAAALCEGWLLHATESPSSVPVLTRHGLVFLDDAGDWRAA